LSQKIKTVGKKIAVMKGSECVLDCLAGFGLLGRRGKQQPDTLEDREGILFWGDSR
jgi:hypothetical protein